MSHESLFGLPFDAGLKRAFLERGAQSNRRDDATTQPGAQGRRHRRPKPPRTRVHADHQWNKLSSVHRARRICDVRTPGVSPRRRAGGARLSGVTSCERLRPVAGAVTAHTSSRPPKKFEQRPRPPKANHAWAREGPHLSDLELFRCPDSCPIWTWRHRVLKGAKAMICLTVRHRVIKASIFMTDRS